jgi:hypothetical protein
MRQVDIESLIIAGIMLILGALNLFLPNVSIRIGKKLADLIGRETDPRLSVLIRWCRFVGAWLILMGAYIIILPPQQNLWVTFDVLWGKVSSFQWFFEF